MLVECAWAALRYNAWARAIYERIHGGQKSRRKKAAIALARKLAVVAWAMMRDETDWDIARLMPECELEQGAIEVTQEPNLPAGPVRHLPKPLREEATAASDTAASRGSLEGGCNDPSKGIPASQVEPQPQADSAATSGQPPAGTTRPRNSGSRSEGARRRGEQHLDVTNGARGHRTSGARSPKPAARARQKHKHGLGDSGPLSKGSRRRDTLT
jgi:transposase